MKSQPNYIAFELAKKERNGKMKTLEYRLPIDSDGETHFTCFLQQLKKDGVHLRNNDLQRIASDYATAIVEGFKQGVIPIERLDLHGIPLEFINH